MDKKQKIQLIAQLSKNLQFFKPNLSNHFICPVCFKLVDNSKTDQITQAHIIPKATNGKLVTLLCKRCNNTFGSEQDKWFGDLLNIHKSESKNVLASNFKSSFFNVDGVKVNGKWEYIKGDVLRFYYGKENNSPSTMSELRNKFGQSPNKISITVPVPFLENYSKAIIGLMTAGYLMWFRMFGYSWVFQSHLDLIRKQILNPNTAIVNNCTFVCKDFSLEPWVGIIKLKNHFFPAFGYNSFISIFPSKYEPHIFNNLDATNDNLSTNNVRPILHTGALSYDSCPILFFEDKMMIVPDDLIQVAGKIVGLLLTNDSRDIKVLYPDTNNTWDKMVAENSIKIFEAKL